MRKRGRIDCRAHRWAATTDNDYRLPQCPALKPQASSLKPRSPPHSPVTPNFIANAFLAAAARAGDADLPASPRAARCARTPPRIPNGRRAAIPAHYLTELALTFAKSRLPKPVSSSHPDFAL
ncbi:hypothetical protein DO65_6182 [Burkholderia pseudomallei]|nr:hypothetical protein DO65_6182 [Burkholderia pseudomallei]